MIILQRLKSFFANHVIQMTVRGLLLTLSVYVLVTWIGLTLFHETAITDLSIFFYWLLVTASTVGYGDFSPVTPGGQLFTAIFVIPFGLSMFAMSAGKVAALVLNQWQKGMNGLRALSMNNHILVIGWRGQRTAHLLTLLLRETQQNLQRQVVLCVDKVMENPMPDAIHFVQVESFSNSKELERACVADADIIIVDTEADDTTLTTALYCAKINTRANLIAYFQEEQLSELLKLHCPRAECMPSIATELMVKSAMDPGSSQLHHQLLSVAHGMTQYSATYPKECTAIAFSKIFHVFKEKHNATAIGIEQDGQLLVNPALDHQVLPGNRVYYIAEKRILQISWETLSHV
ncbi:potassium channel family protein [Zooshikella ganghwensis]|uniref:Potassium channel protein n=1 Tax=Zooshikella ganghwensis TaxID=202772 RepID=A0A4P9VUL9_9GAMM|nr:potassium channel family protein [Zooshikella ganghwensis]RDH46032.1 potassium channel protein [Zooshikella ganghwensis]